MAGPARVSDLKEGDYTKWDHEMWVELTRNDDGLFLDGFRAEPSPSGLSFTLARWKWGTNPRFAVLAPDEFLEVCPPGNEAVGHKWSKGRNDCERVARSWLQATEAALAPATSGPCLSLQEWAAFVQSGFFVRSEFFCAEAVAALNVNLRITQGGSLKSHVYRPQIVTDADFVRRTMQPAAQLIAEIFGCRGIDLSMPTEVEILVAAAASGKRQRQDGWELAGAVIDGIHTSGGDGRAVQVPKGELTTASLLVTVFLTAADVKNGGTLEVSPGSHVALARWLKAEPQSVGALATYGAKVFPPVAALEDVDERAGTLVVSAGSVVHRWTAWAAGSRPMVAVVGRLLSPARSSGEASVADSLLFPDVLAQSKVI